jgi:pyruvate formate lyase activating enzyme
MLPPSKIKGLVFNIQRFSLNDGPGIRTTVFLKGCPIRCPWCHNPEGLAAVKEVNFISSKCILCKKCIEVCPSNARFLHKNQIIYIRSNCTSCGSCIDICNTGASIWIGKIMTVRKVIKEVIKDVVFYNRSGGGVTFSGGEPTSQFIFLKELLKEAKNKNIETALDTSGYLSWENFNEILPYTDIFLFDLKILDNKKHEEILGIDNNLILNNLKNLAELSIKRIIIRVPIIPCVNNSFEEIEKIAEFISTLKNIELTELVPYHPLGLGKYEALGKENIFNNIEPLKKRDLKLIEKVFLDKSINIRIG